MRSISASRRRRGHPAGDLVRRCQVCAGIEVRRRIPGRPQTRPRAHDAFPRVSTSHRNSHSRGCDPVREKDGEHDLGSLVPDIWSFWPKIMGSARYANVRYASYHYEVDMSGHSVGGHRRSRGEAGMSARSRRPANPDSPATSAVRPAAPGPHEMRGPHSSSCGRGWDTHLNVRQRHGAPFWHHDGGTPVSAPRTTGE